MTAQQIQRRAARKAAVIAEFERCQREGRPFSVPTVALMLEISDMLIRRMLREEGLIGPPVPIPDQVRIRDSEIESRIAVVRAYKLGTASEGQPGGLAEEVLEKILP